MTEFATERDRIGAVQSLVDNAGWQRWLQPVIMDRMKQTMETLAGSRSDTDDIKRGWFQALRWVLNLPGQEIETYKVSEREQAKTNEIVADDDHRARYGFRSPYRQAPAPGETKGESDNGGDTTSLPIGV